MSVSIDVSGITADQYLFAASPLAELGSALHLLVEPAHHPRQTGWITAAGVQIDPGLMDRIVARPHPEMPPDSPLQWGAEVVVTTTAGQRVAARVDDYPSRGPAGTPMTHDELWTKFSDCAARALPKAQAAPLFDALAAVDRLDTVATLTRLLEPRAAA